MSGNECQSTRFRAQAEWRQPLPDPVMGRTLPDMSGLTIVAYQQQPNAIGGSLGLSALVSLLPLAVVLVLLGGFKVRAQWAALAGLVTALLVAILGFGMPAGMAVLAALHGAFYGLFPIMWIVVNALWIFNMTVATGHFDVLRRSFGAFSADQRTQAILIAFCFGALLEALAGFGAPVAITSVMLIALGFAPMRAAVIGAGGQHRARRVRGDGRADHHAVAGQWPATAPGGVDGGTADAAARGVRPARAGVHRGRQARAARGVGARARLRHRVRVGPVRLRRTSSRCRSPTSSRRCWAPWP